MMSFNLKAMRKAFDSSRTVKSYSGERQASYEDDCTEAKYPTFEDFLYAEFPVFYDNLLDMCYVDDCNDSGRCSNFYDSHILFLIFILQ